MTPQFITTCSVRVDDPIKRKDIILRLESNGYENVYGGSVGDNIVVAANDMCGVDYRCNVAGCIDCGTNTDLFLALAGMRSDTDYMQWFTTDHSCWCPRYGGLKAGDMVIYDHDVIGHYPLLRRATAQEIIEHFNQQSK